MTEQRLLVSGATGFLGTALLRELQTPVMALLRGTDFVARAQTLSRHANSDVSPIVGALDQDLWGLEERIDELRGKVRTVVHLAADTRWAAPWDELQTTNVDGAIRAVEVAAAVDAPLVHVSTLYAAYDGGDVVPQRLVPEREVLSKYERSKCRAEWLVTDHAERLGVPTLIVRVGALCGDAAPSANASARRRTPLVRLFNQTSRRYWPDAPGARLDVCPRDVVARRLRVLVDAPPIAGVTLRNVGTGGRAPAIAALLHQIAVTLRRQEARPIVPVPVPAAWLRRASATADRAATGPRAARDDRSPVLRVVVHLRSRGRDRRSAGDTRPRAGSARHAGQRSG